MKGKYYLSQVLTPNRFKGGFLNIVNCPPGSGKTYFVFNELPKYVGCNNYILYITDTNMSKQQIISTFSEAKEYSKKWREFINKNDNLVPNGWGDYANSYITTMNYAQVAAIIHYGNPFDWSKFKFIVCDELHNLINYQTIRVEGQTVNILKRAQEKINDTLKNYPNVAIIALTATPNKVYKSFNKVFNVLTPQECQDLIQYETFDIRTYNDLQQILDIIPQGAKGIIYCCKINDLIKNEKYLTQKKHKVASIWSASRQNKVMDKRQWRVRDYIIKNQSIPDDIDILLINGACETGVNIKNNDICFMVIHSDNSDTITQVRGRLRKDLQLMFTCQAKLSNKNKTTPTPISLTPIIPQEYLNRYLTNEEKEQLCSNVIRLMKPNGKPYKWGKVKEYLLNNGYKITEKREDKKRTHIIEKS